MTHRVVRWFGLSCLLMGCWIVLSGKFDFFHLGVGGLAALIVAACHYPWHRTQPLPIGRMIAFIPWLLVRVVMSNLRVARQVLARQPDIQPSLVRSRPRLQGDVALTILGCSITLTPGTLTVEVGEDHLLVHALDRGSRLETEQGLIENRLRRVFVRNAP